MDLNRHETIDVGPHLFRLLEQLLKGNKMASVTATFTVTVNPGSTGPALTLTPNGGALPQETVGTADAGDVVATVSGGTGPYTFAVTNGALPDGMSLGATQNADGSETIDIAGTPTVAGDFSFDLTVTDSLGSSAALSARRRVL